MGKLIGAVIGVMVLSVFVAALSLVPFLLAWNYISPLFNLPYLNWLQALAILVTVYSLGTGFRSTK